MHICLPSTEVEHTSQLLAINIAGMSDDYCPLIILRPISTQTGLFSPYVAGQSKNSVGCLSGVRVDPVSTTNTFWRFCWLYRIADYPIIGCSSIPNLWPDITDWLHVLGPHFRYLNGGDQRLPKIDLRSLFNGCSHENLQVHKSESAYEPSILFFTNENSPPRARRIERVTQQVATHLDDLKAHFLNLRVQLRGRI